MSYQQIKLTKAGRALIEESVVAGEPIQFAQARLSSQKYTDGDLKNIEELESTQSTSELRSIEEVGQGLVQFSTVFSNEGSDSGYTVHSIGVYAKNPKYIEPEPTEENWIKENPDVEESTSIQVEESEGHEEGPEGEEEVQEAKEKPYILYGVALSGEQPFYMAPMTGNPTTLTLKLTVGVGEAESVILKVNKAGVVYQSDLEPILKPLEEDINKISVDVATQAIESFELNNAISVVKDMESAQSQAEIFEMLMLMMEGGL